MRSENRRWKHTGKGAGRSFVQIPHFVLESAEFAALPPYAVKLLFELVRQYKGNNNGVLSATITELKPRGVTSEPTLWKHLTHLEQTGWIVRTRQGGRYLGCNLYAVTWWPINDGGGKHPMQAERKPSHLWKNAIATTKNEVRSIQKMKCEPIKLQKMKRETVPVRSVA